MHFTHTHQPLDFLKSIFWLRCHDSTDDHITSSFKTWTFSNHPKHTFPTTLLGLDHMHANWLLTIQMLAGTGVSGCSPIWLLSQFLFSGTIPGLHVLTGVGLLPSSILCSYPRWFFKTQTSLDGVCLFLGLHCTYTTR